MTATTRQPRDDARNLALDTLITIEKHRSPSHLVIRDVLQAHPDLDQREERFYRKLVNGVLEWQIRLDYIIDQFSKTRTRKMKPVIRAILRLAVYQIQFLDAVPDSAAVNEAVRMAVQRGFGSLRGFVNGVLRAILRGRDSIREPERDKDPVQYYSVMYSMPVYLTERWLKTFGEAKTEQICASFQEPAPLTVRFRDELTGSGKHPAAGEAESCGTIRGRKQAGARQILQEAGVQITQAPYIPYAASLSGVTDLEKNPAFADGLIAVQDVSSMLAVEAAGIRPGDLVLDLAAAPGGKSMLAADILQRAAEDSSDAAGKVIARDVSEQKAELIRDNIGRLQIANIEVQVWDGTVFDPSMEGKADVVIADLPCSGLGVIGRKPDIRYEASDEKTESLVQLQRQILKNAVRYVRPGGTLLYSTCTFDPRENEENVDWILASSDLKPDPAAPYLPAELAAEAGSRNYLQLYPGIHACDGFFIARFRR
ncbi:MAG: 16S rRNA (cytosine(967)-C(5))-methyltransferase RsmB [Eubacterium sp.]|nr:16S rRNA (cytosine(967)-C(5))-methyltransferase RsmB [Eubacterium sp.]